VIPARRQPLPERPATVNLGDTASAWPSNITIHVTTVQGRPTYHATITDQPRKDQR
jgi:hypothetical protein